jgi:hypothetical protein
MQAMAVPVSREDNDISKIYTTYTTPVAYRGSAVLSPRQVQFSEPAYVPKRKQAHPIVRLNKVVSAVTVALWSLAILGYGLDVSASNEVSRLQDRARRLSEQNTELSARVLKAISFQGIQDRALGQLSLSVPEQVLIVKEVPPSPTPEFHPQKHHLPLLPGF